MAKLLDAATGDEEYLADFDGPAGPRDAWLARTLPRAPSPTLIPNDCDQQETVITDNHNPHHVDSEEANDSDFEADSESNPPTNIETGHFSKWRPNGEIVTKGYSSLIKDLPVSFT